MEAIEYDEHYTLEDYRRWEGEWELIEGRPYAMSPAPGITHQRISFMITRLLTDSLQKDGCENCFAVQDIDYEISDDTVVRPDVALICDQYGEKVTKAPEIVFEIISSSTARRDETVKFEIYRREGVRYYVLVYPSLKTAKIYGFHEDGSYRKMADVQRENFSFELRKCRIDMEFSAIWPENI
ncbi:Uma2 family endonuclease [Hydrogenimonas sp.]